MSDIKYDYNGRNYVVTGAASGMGKSCCEELIKAGATVFGIDRDMGTVEDGSYTHYQLDVTDESSVKETVADIVSKCSKIDGLINAAGVFASNKPFYELDIEEWNKVVGINLTGTFLMSKYVASDMISHKKGRIVNISCIRSTIFKENMADYAASKGGVSALTSAMALDIAPYDIRVNAVAPGFIRTGMTAKAFDDPAVASSSEKLIPAGMGDVEIYTEMGRFMTGPYGMLVTKVLHEKKIYNE